MSYGPMAADIFMTAEAGAISEDALLGGRLILRQPVRGHRFGHDAVLLAAATPARAGQHAIELGAGVGAAGLALAWRVDGLTVTLVELDASLAALARENAARNVLGKRVRAVWLDVAAPPAQFVSAGLTPGVADHVFMNPPFNAPHNPTTGARRIARHARTVDRYGGAAFAPARRFDSDLARRWSCRTACGTGGRLWRDRDYAGLFQARGGRDSPSRARNQRQ
jgi:hypothetical protein